MLVLEKTFSSILIPLQIILLYEKIQGHFPNTEQKDKQYSQQLLISMSNVYFYAIVSLAQFAKERNPKNLIIIIIINIFGIFSLQLEERKYTNWYQNHHFFHTVLASCISFPWMPLLFEDGEISTGKNVLIHSNNHGEVFVSECIFVLVHSITNRHSLIT